MPTVFFNVLYIFVIIDHKNRKLVHFNITEHPSAKWTSQQIINAFPYDSAPRYLFRDRDSIYGSVFKERIKNMDINEIISAPRSPWQNPFIKRAIGSIRRECLDHTIIFSEKHLMGILKSYVDYYNNDRTHLGLNKDSPSARPVQNKPDNSEIIEIPKVGGLHHRYEWKNAA